MSMCDEDCGNVVEQEDTTINGLSVEDARKLSKPEHYSLHIDEDSDDKAYLLRVVGKEEEE
mgnify:CR=1 FL=1